MLTLRVKLLALQAADVGFAAWGEAPLEVDRADSLGIGAAPVEESVGALARDGQLHLVGAVAEAVVVDPVLEVLRLSFVESTCWARRHLSDAARGPKRRRFTSVIIRRAGSEVKR